MHKNRVRGYNKRFYQGRLNRCGYALPCFRINKTERSIITTTK